MSPTLITYLPIRAITLYRHCDRDGHRNILDWEMSTLWTSIGLLYSAILTASSIPARSILSVFNVVLSKQWLEWGIDNIEALIGLDGACFGKNVFTELGLD